MMTPDQPTASKLKRRWYQYSLRTLMIFVSLFAIACSWFAVKMQQAKKQREAIEAIWKVGGNVRYDYQYDASGHEIQNAVSPVPSWLRNMLGDNFFCTVIDAELKNDVSMSYLKELNKIQFLWLEGSKITDAGLEHLNGLTQLKELYLISNQVTDEGLEHLKGLTQLKTLCLLTSHVTDTGLECLKGLTQLQELVLDSRKVTDTGLEHLKGLTQLKKLDLRGTMVRSEGVITLQQALPNCNISHRFNAPH